MGFVKIRLLKGRVECRAGALPVPFGADFVCIMTI
jgi:hypothetical protein